MNEKVSIIIPVYNAERYLTECIESVVHQTYFNIEILLINDGSIDSSGKICNEYLYKDSRIKAFHMQNEGVSSARNLGLEKATGKWIMFLDSDDYLDTRAIGYLVDIANKESVDVVSCSYYSNYMNRKDLHGSNDGDIEIFSCGDDEYLRKMIVYPSEVLSSYPTALVPWGKIIKKDILATNNCHYQRNLFLHEDAYYNINYYRYTSRQAYLHKPLLYYRQRRISATKSKTKDYFSNNKIYCEMIGDIKSSKGNQLLSKDEYNITCIKYLIYGMINLKSYCSGNLIEAKKQLKKYIEDPFFADKLDMILESDLSSYGFSKRLEVAIDAARRKKINHLLVYAWLTDYRSKYIEYNPICKRLRYP